MLAIVPLCTCRLFLALLRFSRQWAFFWRRMYSGVGLLIHKGTRGSQHMFTTRIWDHNVKYTLSENQLKENTNITPPPPPPTTPCTALSMKPYWMTLVVLVAGNSEENHSNCCKKL